MICYDLFLVRIQMSYYFVNRQVLMQKAEDRCGGKEMAAEYYIVNKENCKNAKNKHRSLSE